MDSVPCVVSMDTSAYYDKLDEWESFDEGLYAYVTEYYVDEIIWEGRVVLGQFRDLSGKNHIVYIYLNEVMSDYIEEKEDGDFTKFNMLSCNTVTGKIEDKDMAQQYLADYIKEAVEWWFLDDDRIEDHKGEYESHLEDERRDAEEARCGI